MSTAGRSRDERRSLRLGRNPPRGQTCCGRARRPARIAPTARAVTAANVPDILQLEPLVAALPAVAGRPGRPRRKPGAVQGDRAYWSRARHARLAAQGIVAVVAKPGSPHGSGLGVFRWVVERTLAWLHRFRRLALRYERRADAHEAFLTLGCALITWRYLKREF